MLVKTVHVLTCVSVRERVVVRLKLCVSVCLSVRVRGNGLICLCILTMFIRTAAAPLMRNTFGLILLPHAIETGGGPFRIQTLLIQHTLGQTLTRVFFHFY